MADLSSYNDEYTYVDKSTGAKVKFTAKADEAMVAFPQPMAEDVTEVLTGAPTLSVSEGINAVNQISPRKNP